MTTIRDGAVLGSHDGQVVQLVGTYVVKSTGRYTVLFTRPDGTTGETNEIVKIRLEGNVLVDLGARPDDEMAQLKGKVVLATGKLIAKPTRAPDFMAQPDPQPTLVQIASVVAQPSSGGPAAASLRVMETIEIEAAYDLFAHQSDGVLKVAIRP